MPARSPCKSPHKIKTPDLDTSPQNDPDVLNGRIAPFKSPFKSVLRARKRLAGISDDDEAPYTPSKKAKTSVGLGIMMAEVKESPTRTSRGISLATAEVPSAKELHVQETDQEKLTRYKRDPILNHYGPELLRTHGFINWKAPLAPPLSDDFSHAPSCIKPYVDMSEWNPLHPIFKKQNFVCSDEEYDTLLPALRLASSFLSEPEMQPFFQSLMDFEKYTTVTAPKYEARMKQDVKIFRPQPMDVKNPSEDAAQTWITVAKVQKYVEFIVTDKDSEEDDGDESYVKDHTDTFMWTNAWRGDDQDKALSGPGIDPYGTTRRSLVSIPQRWIQTLQAQGAKSQKFPSAEDNDRKAAHHRTVLLAAIVLLHEMTHVLFQATYPEKSDYAEWTVEPFFQDDYATEAGFACEQYLFNTTIGPIGFEPEFLSCPYGLLGSRFPGIEPHDAIKRATSYGAGEMCSHVFAIHMSDVYKFFTREFWRSKVPAKGRRAYAPRRLVGFRTELDVEKRRLDRTIDESPTSLLGPYERPRKAKRLKAKAKPKKAVRAGESTEGDASESTEGYGNSRVVIQRAGTPPPNIVEKKDLHTLASLLAEISEEEPSRDA